MDTPTESLTTEEVPTEAPKVDYAAMGARAIAGGMTPAAPEPEPVVETPPEPEKTPEMNKELQAKQQIAASLKRLEDRQVKLEEEIVARSKPATVEQQQELRTIASKKERAVSKLREIQKVSVDDRNFVTDAATLVDAAAETDDELQATRAELKALMDEVKPILEEKRVAAAWQEAEKHDPDARENFQKCVDDAIEELGLKSDEEPDDAMRDVVQRLARGKYQKLLKTLKPETKIKTATRQPPKTPGGGSIVGNRTPGTPGTTQTHEYDYAALGRRAIQGATT